MYHVLYDMVHIIWTDGVCMYFMYHTILTGGRLFAVQHRLTWLRSRHALSIHRCDQHTLSMTADCTVDQLCQPLRCRLLHFWCVTSLVIALSCCMHTDHANCHVGTFSSRCKYMYQLALVTWPYEIETRVYLGCLVAPSFPKSLMYADRYAGCCHTRLHLCMCMCCLASGSSCW